MIFRPMGNVVNGALSSPNTKVRKQDFVQVSIERGSFGSRGDSPRFKEQNIWVYRKREKNVLEFQ